jgi:hypothetical protein
MLDIHPAHHAASSWRDFFIHIATISVGLLIAIGLEQSVEALHRHHERDLLTQEMRTEAHKNTAYLRIHLDADLAQARWYHQAAQEIRAVQPVDGMIAVTLPPAPNQTPTAIGSRSVWSVARASGKMALLPEEQAEAYDRVDFDADLALHANQNLSDASAKLAALFLQLNLSNPPTGSITIPAAQQADLVSQMELRSALLHQAAYDEFPWLAGSDALADGVTMQEDIWPYFRRESKMLKP